MYYTVQYTINQPKYIRYRRLAQKQNKQQQHIIKQHTMKSLLQNSSFI